MTFDTFFNQEPPPGGAQRTGAGSTIPGGRVFRFSRLTLFAIALAISGRADADSLSAPFTALRVNSAPGVFNSVSGSATGEVDSRSSGGNPADNSAFDDTATASVTLYSTPVVNVSVSGMGVIGPGIASASASVIYDLEVTGPIPLLPVPVSVSGVLSSLFEPGASFNALGLVQFINDDASTDFTASICPPDSPAGCASTQVSPDQFYSHLMFYSTGDVESVELFVAVSLIGASGTGPSGNFFGSVTVDPIFTIDPAFLAQNPGYSLEFSDGVGNTPGTPPDTPEPATWAMMLGGFGGLGVLFRHSHAFRRSS
jgi:hypothetical protein